MSKSTKRTQSETLSMLTNAGENQSKEVFSNTELVGLEDIAGTPFKMVGNDVDGYFLGFGKYRMSEVYNDKLGVLEYMNEHTWTLITKLIAVILEFDKEIAKEKEVL